MAAHNSFIGLAQLVAEGKTCEELALHYGVCRQTVKRAADLRGIAIRRKAQPESPVVALVLHLVAEGKTLREIAAAAGISYSKACYISKRCGLTPQKRGKEAVERIDKMALMHSQGCTLERIGAHFGITREGVRQLLLSVGIGPENGGQKVRAREKKAALRAKRDAHCISMYGMALEEVQPYQKRGLTRAYRQQQHSAESRGIPFSLTFPQWLSIWETSGKIHLRGKGKGHYCMSRITDTGGYAVGNVHIQLTTDNSREAVKKWLGKTKANRGVFHLYPGLSRPWMAKVGKKSLGLFATEDEAVAVRNEWMAANRSGHNSAARA